VEQIKRLAPSSRGASDPFRTFGLGYEIEIPTGGVTFLLSRGPCWSTPLSHDPVAGFFLLSGVGAVAAT
jgi:hypothetical protein